MKEKKINAYKGFDKDLKCRGFQYEVGKEYEMDGDIECCQSGFRACEYPLNVFECYNPSNSRFCQVEQSGEIETNGDKTSSSRIRVQCEIGIKGIVEASVKFILDKVNWKDRKATNTGNYSAATNTGNYSAATNTGYFSAATNTGDNSAATNTGNNSAATVNGKDSVAIVTGRDSKAKGSLGSWIVLTERREWNGETYPIKEVKAVKVDGERIKVDTFYKLIDGEFVEQK